MKRLVEFYACDTCGHAWTQDKNKRHTAKKKVAQPAMKFRVVQPWGPDKGRQSTVQSEHKTVAEAFAALDVVATDMEQSGVPGDAIELVVVDEHGRVVPRPNTTETDDVLETPDDVIAAHRAEQEHIQGEGSGPDVAVPENESAEHTSM